VNGYPELSQIEGALVGAAGRLAAGRPRRRRPRLALIAALALLLMIGIAAIAGASGDGPFADRLDGIFGPDAAPPAPAVLPAEGEETKHAIGVPDGAPGHVLVPATPEQPISVYAYATGGRVCLVVGGKAGGIGHCEGEFYEAHGHASVELGVVDTRPFVWGLADDEVVSADVSIAGQHFPTTLAHSAYFAALPSQEVASHPITVAFHMKDGTTLVERAPGLPRPISAPGVSSGSTP
jgi:hypothetical protein